MAGRERIFDLTTMAHVVVLRFVKEQFCWKVEVQAHVNKNYRQAEPLFFKGHGTSPRQTAYTFGAKEGIEAIVGLMELVTRHPFMRVTDHESEVIYYRKDYQNSLCIN